MDDVRRRNDFIVNLFLNRTPDDRIDMKLSTGIREIVEFDADFVDKAVSKRLNMEFDWKRRPNAVWNDPDTSHVAFSTDPWETIDQFIEMRGYWDKFVDDSPRCLKSVDDFHELGIHVLSQSSLGKEAAKYLKRKNPDLQRLRQSLCAAWQKSKGGLTKKVDGKTMEAFAAILCEAGIPCKRLDVENARTAFKPKNCPSTRVVWAALRKLEAVFPSLEVEAFVTAGEGIDLTGAIDASCPYVPLDRQNAMPDVS